jgi:Domain of unknown function (DUF4159)
MAWILTCGMLWHPSAVEAAAPEKESLVERVNKAIEAGVSFLRDRARGNGSWEEQPDGVLHYPGGFTALAMLALLNSGVKPDDPIIERSLKELRKFEPERTYVVGLQTMVFAELGRSEDKERIQRNVDWLVNARVIKGGTCQGWTYTNHPNAPDNSNTQYALLGLHAGQQAGAKIDREVWAGVQDMYIRSQLPEGGWNYKPGTAPMLTMTTAGLSGLIIAGIELNSGREKTRPDGTATNCGQYEENRPATRALGWIGRNFKLKMVEAMYYNLYGIERAGRLSGVRFMGEYDWYRAGCEFLTAPGIQHEDGSWSARTPHDSWPVVSTSFALLFLSKGRTPVLVSKLVHGPGDDWNNDRNDVRNLVDHASRELFRGRPMAWQVFDVSRLEVNSDQHALELAMELAKSPVVYFNGHASPTFRGVDKQILKNYVEQGGFIFAEACCGRNEFDNGFRALMKEIFPDHELRPLPAEHPIWRSHAMVPPGSFPLEGIDYGCKTVVVYSPKDLSCSWEGNLSKEGRGELAFRVGENVIAYATGMEPPQARLALVDAVVNDPTGKSIPRGYLKVAQLRHDGDWQPAPNAMRALMSDLRKNAQLDVALEPKAISSTDSALADYKFLYMHGRAAFQVSAEGAKNLRTDLETGGTLLADACCGKKAFDTSFRAFVEQVFPGNKLEPIPLSDDLYSKDLNGQAVTSVRCRTEAAGGTDKPGEFRAMAPALEGVRIGKRWAIIYSKYDLGCALEKHQSTDCLGHDHASALLLGKAAVFYALGR